MLLRTKRSARAGAAIGLLAAVSVLTAACTTVDASSPSAVAVTVAGTSAAGASSGASSSPTTTAAPVPVAQVTSSPQLGDDAVTPIQPITITVARGIITDLKVTNPEGAKVDGTLSP